MTTKHPNFNYMMAEHLNVQIDLIKELQGFYKAALLRKDKATLEQLEREIKREISFLHELYEVL